MARIRLALILYCFMVAHKAARQTLSKASWRLWRHDRGLAGVGDIYYRKFVVWRSSLLVASVCSVWSSAWLCMGDWWGWLFGSSGTAVRLPFGGSVMNKDWVHGVGSWTQSLSVCQILLQTVVRAVITPSPPAWTSSAGMLSTSADFHFFNDYTAASTSLRRMGWWSFVSV